MGVCVCVCFSPGQQMEDLWQIRIIIWVKHAKMFAKPMSRKMHHLRAGSGTGAGDGAAAELGLSAASVSGCHKIVCHFFQCISLKSCAAIDKISL